MKPLSWVLATAGMGIALWQGEIWLVALSFLGAGLVFGIEFSRWKIGEQS